MSSFFSFLPAGGWQRLMCDALWQSTLIAGLGWLAARFLVRQSAARAWVLLVTLIACAVVPLASLAARSGGWTMLAAGEQFAPNLVDVKATTEIAPSTPKAQGRPSLGFRVDNAPQLAHDVETPAPEQVSFLPATIPIPAHHASPARTTNLPLPAAGEGRGEGQRTNWLLHVFGFTWLAAAASLAVRLMFSLTATRRLLHRAVSCDDPAMLAAAAEAAKRIRIACPPLLLSRDIETPTIYALGRPRLLIPLVEASLRDAKSELLSSVAFVEPEKAGAISRLGETRPPNEMQPRVDWIAAFSHELAHVARGDGWSRLGVECVLVMLPVQPLIWLLRRSFHTACEESCDDWAVATGSNPIDLADTLTAWIRQPRYAASVVAIGVSSTKARTLRLLHMRKIPNARLSSLCFWAGTFVAMLSITGLALAQVSASRTESKNGNATIDSNSSISDDSVSSRSASVSDASAANDQIEQVIAADSLIALYKQQIAISQNELEQAPAAGYSKILRDRIDDLKKRLEKRTAQLTPRITSELAEQKISAAQKSKVEKGRQPPERPYVIEPPDILQIDSAQLVPKKSFRIAPFDKVKIVADPTTTKLDNPISGTFQVDSAGEVVLGAAYGAVKISGLTRFEAEEAVLIKLQETLKDPLVALTIDESRLEAGITGRHLVGPDGTINLGVYGQVKVGGLTVQEARKAVEEKLGTEFVNPIVSLDVFSYNSKVFYVIISGLGKADHVSRLPITGNDRVLDAISLVPGLTGVADAQVFILRSTSNDGEKTIRINWAKAMQGQSSDNPEILAGDRLFITEANANSTPADLSKSADSANSQAKSGTVRAKQAEVQSVPPTEVKMAPLPPYEIESPDILLISDVQLVPKEPYTIQPLDILQVEADPNSTKFDNQIRGLYLVEPAGMLNLGAAYGKIKVAGLSLSEARAAVLKQLRKTLKDPKVTMTLNESGGKQQVSGEHLVGPDGTINLGPYGQVYVSQLTIPEAKEAIEKKLAETFEKPKVSVDIYAYNSKVYYVITRGHGFGDNIQRYPVTGNETVLDAISQVQGLSLLGNPKVWIERPKSRYSSVEKKFEVKWDEITQGGGANLNYQILPGDRIYIDNPQTLGKDPKKLDAPAGALPGTSNF
jgi:polysaccharide biosynthesis/export protein